MKIKLASLVALSVTITACKPPPPPPAAPAAGKRPAPAATDTASSAPRTPTTGGLHPPPRVAGPLVFTPGSFEFGTVPPKSEHHVTMGIRNQSGRPIRIVQAKPTCLCTTPEDIDGRTIAPGEMLTYSMSFRAPTETGEKKASVAMVYNYNGQDRSVRFDLRADVTMAVRADPPYVTALKGTTSGVLKLDSTDGRPFSILSAGGRDPVYTNGFDPHGDSPRSVYTLEWTVPARSRQDCDGMRLWWVIETDHPDCPVLPLYIRHECTGYNRDPGQVERGWFFKEYIANLGGVDAGQPVEVEVELNNGGAVPITSVQCVSHGATAELLGTEQTHANITTCRVRYTPAPGRTGLFYEMVMFNSTTGSKEIAFIGKVMP